MLFLFQFFFFQAVYCAHNRAVGGSGKEGGGGGVKGESFGYTPNLNPYLRKRAGVYGQRKPYV